MLLSSNENLLLRELPLWVDGDEAGALILVEDLVSIPLAPGLPPWPPDELVAEEGGELAPVVQIRRPAICDLSQDRAATPSRVDSDHSTS